MSKGLRPPSIAVQGTQRADEDGGLGDRQSSLLPGQVRTPSYIVTMADWAAPGSSVWDEDSTPVPQSEAMRTPLAGYVNEGEVWVTEEETSTPAATAAGEDGADPAHVAHEALTELREQLHQSPTSAAPFVVQPQPPARPAMPRTESEYWGFSTNPNQQRGSPNGASPQENTGTGGGGGFTFRVSDGTENAPAPMNPGSMAPMGAFTASTGRIAPVTTRAPTLDDERVAHSIIASAGLPLSVTSLRSYIKEGQPHLEQQPSASSTGHRNFPNLSEPAPEEMGPMPGSGYNNQSHGGRGGGMGGGAGGGWTVEVEAGGPGQYRGGYQGNQNNNMGYGNNNNNNGGGMLMGGGQGGAYRSGPASGYNAMPGANAGGGNNAGPRRFQQPSYASIVAGNHSGSHNPYSTNSAGGAFVAPNMMGGGVQQQQQQHQQQRGAPAVSGMPSGNRAKSESEILSDLLHFHANFFPPPPPPSVPVEERRRRAELWYHYASKWDITHRLPPPPRSPLAEMEMEYRMKLPEKTRVPYHGDDWLRQCDHWFRVVQSLFDYPEENITVEADLNVILENAILS